MPSSYVRGPVRHKLWEAKSKPSQKAISPKLQTADLLAKMWFFQKASVWETNWNPAFLLFITTCSVACSRNFQNHEFRKEHCIVDLFVV